MTAAFVDDITADRFNPGWARRATRSYLDLWGRRRERKKTTTLRRYFQRLATPAKYTRRSMKTRPVFTLYPPAYTVDRDRARIGTIRVFCLRDAVNCFPVRRVSGAGTQTKRAPSE